MKKFKHTIVDELGLHARPAGQLVKTASQFSSEITVLAGSKKADGKKIMSVMMLGAKKGDDMIIQIEGNDEEAAEQELKKFLKENL